MRGNLLVVARVGGSEILRPRVQRGGERSVGVKFPNSSPKIFFAFGLHRERAEIAAGGARFFPNDLRCGFRKLKEQGVGNPHSGAAVVPKSLLVLLL